MEEKRLISVPLALWEKIEKNRGDLSAADFIDLAIESQLHQEVIRDQELTGEIERAEARRGEIEQIKQAVEALLRSEEERTAAIQEEQKDIRKVKAGAIYVSRQELEAVKNRVRELEKGFWLFRPVRRLFRREAK